MLLSVAQKKFTRNKLTRQTTHGYRLTSYSQVLVDIYRELFDYILVSETQIGNEWYCTVINIM